MSTKNQNMSDLNTRSIAVRDQNWMSDVDLNSIEGNGIFFLSTNISNAPLSNTAWAIMIQIQRDNRDAIRQIFLGDKVYYRKYQDSGWQSWMTL